MPTLCRRPSVAAIRSLTEEREYLAYALCETDIWPGVQALRHKLGVDMVAIGTRHAEHSPTCQADQLFHRIPQSLIDSLCNRDVKLAAEALP